jgi:tRNA(Ile)-lysidine synthase
LNPAVRQALAETAEIARAEEAYWAEEVARVLRGIWDEAAACLKLAVFELPLALQRRVLRAVAESLGLRLDFQHVDEILALRNRSGRAELRDGWVVSRNREELRFEHGSAAATGSDYEYRLSIPGSIEVTQTGSRFEATLVPDSANGGYNSEFLLDRALLAAELRIRNWRPGDQFWPAHSKAAKKIKELLQERQVTGGERKLWPVAVSGTEVVWVRGFAAPAQLRPREGKDQAVLIREIEQRGKNMLVDPSLLKKRRLGMTRNP